MQPRADTSQHDIAAAKPFPAAASRKNIAVVEPYLPLRHLYALELQEEGYTALSLTGHVALFCLLADRSVHLVVSGDEEQEREQPERTRLITLALQQSIPLIINTGYPFSWFSVPDSGSIAVVLKSANMEKLKNKIRHMLTRSDKRRPTDGPLLPADSASAAI